MKFPAEPRPLVWDIVTRGLLKGGMDGHGLKPTDIMDMTGPELALIMSENGTRTYSGMVAMSDGEIEAYRKWRAGLSNRELLEYTKRGQA